ncbi:Oidioi.mRNA.OKI2018_I69.chr1.g2083.t1.cds [Oikopleura dioica]|uniref:Oidioi.mRNA.OKI2018_I69.chr1.g2083.t1.cds n=1 Tax=Oikopleura dioica TaxID=34765 RepID=A0ABN7SV34_OIKDI|nr:Oidioi.mRNA.OKI2018_I69.chr1.g2083.t1.cds [Oikopleura dioica]
MDEKDKALVGIVHRRQSKKPEPFQVKHAPVKKRKRKYQRKSLANQTEQQPAPIPPPTKIIKRTKPAAPKKIKPEIIDLTKETQPSERALRMVVNEFLNMKTVWKMTVVHLRILITMRYPELDEKEVHFDKRWRKWVKDELEVRLKRFIPPSAHQD